MNKRIRKTIDEGTPFKVISICGYEIRHYWTKNTGLYGRQVVSAVFSMREGLVCTNITNGCGYSKEAEAEINCYKSINFAPREMIKIIRKNCDATINWKYHVGGNYYRIPNKDVLKIERKEVN